MKPPSRSSWVLIVCALAPILLVTMARLQLATDLDDNDQAKQALYVLDIVEHGNWILPLERGSVGATKPPLNAWLAAGFSLASGGVSELACRLPAILAAFGCAYLILLIGAERFDPRVGVAAAWVFAASHTTIDLATHVRPDMVLALLVTLAFFALHRAEQGRTVGMAATFWAALSMSFLAKGPVGPLLIAVPTVVLFSGVRHRRAFRPILCSRWAWLLALPATWALLAYLVGGSIYLHTTVFQETVHKLGRSDRLGYALLDYLSKSAPWSLLVLTGLAGALRGSSRAAFGLPAAALLAGLVLLSASPTERQDYVLPLLPMSSVLTAGVLAGFAGMGVQRLWRGLLFILGVAALGVGLLALIPDPNGGGVVAWLGAFWGACFALAGLGLITCWRAARKTSDASMGFVFYASVACLLVLHAGYAAVLSPVARDTRRVDTVEVARHVNALREQGALIAFRGGSGNALRFLTRNNTPDLSEPGVRWHLNRRRPGQRAVVFLSGESAETIARLARTEGWPTAPRPIFRHPLGPGAELVGLELVDTGGAE